MNRLDQQDLSFAVTRLPHALKKIMKDPEWIGKIFVGGGYIRSIVSREPVNDVDVFVPSVKEADLLALKLADRKDIWKTDNAYTVKGQGLIIQIIHRWVFDKMEDVSNSFDFTVCCAVIGYVPAVISDGRPETKYNWDSYCDKRFYVDLAAKRLVYRKPVRNEDAGGSMLRVLKYYQKGYRIPLDSLAAVMTRMVDVLDIDMIYRIEQKDGKDVRTSQTEKVLTGLLRAVDPNIDPTHEAHLPKMDTSIAEPDLTPKEDEQGD